MRTLPVFVMVTAGVLVALQGPVNARLRLAAESPALSAAISFLSGGLILLIVAAVGGFGGFGAGWRGLSNAPPWAFLGGALGMTFVLGTIQSLPRVGAVVTICAAILGQMVGTTLIDSFGWLGVTRVPFSPTRALGVLVVFAGVLLVQRR